MSWNLIIGPPGTGKTTKCLAIVEEAIQYKISTKEIAFVAFTRKAANEARGRAQEKFRLSGDELPWFRTLHSLAFQQLGVSKNEVMGIKDYLSIAQTLGLYLTIKGIAEDGTVSGLSKGDRLFFMENQARTLMQPLKDYWSERPDEDINWHELEQVQNTIRQYKEVNGKSDFTDIINQFVDHGVVPKIKVAVIDEAQDLSPLQWRMVERLAKDVNQVYIAGDDDQAIFRWAGADVEKFISLPGYRTVLPQSYRVPVKVQEVANRVISRVSHRIAKDWKPRDEEGEVHYLTGVDQVSMDEGTWLLLARNTFLLEAYNDYCIQMGYIFDSSIGSPIQPRSREAIRLWDMLRRGEQITIDQARTVYEQMSVRERIAYGAKSKLDRAQENVLVSHSDLVRDFGLLTNKEWPVAFDRMQSREREYFLAAIKRGEKLTREPRIRVSTIHSVKGGEADHVVLQTDMAARTYAEYQVNADDEHRVWYVAVTRAKQALYIIQPQTDRSYDI